LKADAQQPKRDFLFKIFLPQIGYYFNYDPYFAQIENVGLWVVIVNTANTYVLFEFFNTKYM